MYNLTNKKKTTYEGRRRGEEDKQFNFQKRTLKNMHAFQNHRFNIREGKLKSD